MGSFCNLGSLWKFIKFREIKGSIELREIKGRLKKKKIELSLSFYLKTVVLNLLENTNLEFYCS